MRAADDFSLRNHSKLVRNTLTSAASRAGFTDGVQYAKITNLTYLRLFGATAKGLRRRMNLGKSQSIRDNLSTTDLTFVMMAENLTADAVEQGESVNEAALYAANLACACRMQYRKHRDGRIKQNS